MVVAHGASVDDKRTPRVTFDGTYDTVASDYLFDTVRTRSIHVDSRYMLWTMTEVDGATNLLKEIGEAPSLDVVAPGH